ncbi:hypothetical protein N658DRAFT_556739 [Parathielavia hyrcaniae]|uniref:Uncharacterized protein n=1 Tax=Parathielavia hyrcaniae TaxID=113614 RepID=A0AAN6Q7D8_9PEZI|nr:hypothetical protein N658DRAFT_556739 [Parathielavia hyrcaniae]
MDFSSFVKHGHSAGQQDSSQFLWELAAPGDEERAGCWELKGARKLVVPGGARVNFAAVHFSEYRTADPPWFKPPPPVEPSDRVFRCAGAETSGRTDWEDCQIHEDYVCGWNIYGEPDVKVYVGQRSDNFTSLNPGESWSTTLSLNERPDICLPPDSMPGDVFRYPVKRSEVDWWDWGTMEEHRETTAMLP